MTAIPTVERTEQTRCNTCACDCVKTCTRCGKNFCKKHLLVHSKKCRDYKTVVRSILYDDIVEISKQILEAVLRSI
jgi:hypothetical protein